MSPRRTALTAALIALTAFGDAASQEAVIPSVGCGSGCSRQIRQIDEPELMDDGWVRVQVEWTEGRFDIYGNETCFRGTCSGDKIRGWNFAQCFKKKFGSGSNADMSDAWLRDPFYDNGEPANTNASGCAYNQWEALCSATAGNITAKGAGRK